MSTLVNMKPRLLVTTLIIFISAGCANHPTPVFIPSTTNSPSVNNEVSGHTLKNSSGFKFRSSGSSQNTHERDTRPVTWVKVDEIKADPLTIVIYAKDSENNVLARFLQLPHDNVKRIGTGTKRDMLVKVLDEMSSFVKDLFAKKAVRLNANIYIAIYDTEVKTPMTPWQYGPVVDPIELNLAASLPPLGEKYEREEGFDDTLWYEQISRIMLHEYAHVVHNNAPDAFTTDLADEFIAHTVDRCAGFLVNEFRGQKFNDTIIEAAGRYANDRDFITQNKPFATSTTGGQLAVTAIAALFTHSELSHATRERRLEILLKYCKMIVDAKPSFATTREALDWIEANVEKATLPFLQSPPHTR
jgi:hypothetical protein